MKNCEELEIVCPICHIHKNNRLGEHIRKEHGDKAFQQPCFGCEKSRLILRYSQPADVVLDYFVGGGTTAVEAKLLGRECCIS